MRSSTLVLTIAATVLAAGANAQQTNAEEVLDRAYQRGLTDASPYLALFGTRDSYRQQFDADTEGYFYQNLARLRPVEDGPGGTLKRWDIANPALWDQDASQALIEFNACGLNLPHVHPRGLEFLHVLTGNLTITFVEENGGRAISRALGPGDSIFVPQGLLHAEHNLGCEPASFMNTFTHVTAGTSTVADALFQFPDYTISTALGNIPIEEVQRMRENLPENLAQGPTECLQRCGIIGENGGAGGENGGDSDDGADGENGGDNDDGEGGGSGTGQGSGNGETGIDIGAILG